MTDTTRASLELLYSISREITSALELHTVLTRVLSLSTASVGAERGSVIVLDEQQMPVDAALIYEGRLTPHTVEQLKATLHQGLAGWVLKTRQPALIPDTSQDIRWLRRPDDEIQGSGTKSVISVPITVREEVVGVLTLVHATPRFFNTEHLALVQSIADQAGTAVQHARLYQSLQAAHRRYRELFEDSIDPMVITSLDGRILEFNRRAEEVSGKQRSELRGRQVWDLHTARPEWLAENMAGIRSGETVSCEAEFGLQQGKSIPVEIYVHATQADGEELLQWILRDITERKELDAMRNDLNAMIYHDLRSPLANIVSSLDMLRTLLEESDPQQVNPIIHQVVNIANRSSDRMQRLINSLLDINRLEAGQPITNRKRVDAVDLINEALDAIQPIAVTKQQNIVREIQKNLPPVWIDEDMIRRVLINLLENATKFTQVEGELRVRAFLQQEWVKFVVEDTGPGIAPEAQAAIFNKFSRGYGADPRFNEYTPRGLGLGLAFCKLAVQAHGGTIGVDSKPGYGSKFHFTVPVVRDF